MFDIAYRIGRSSIRSRFPFVYFAMLPVITISSPPSPMQRGQASLTLRRLVASVCMEERRVLRSRTLLASRRLARFDGTAIFPYSFGRRSEQPARVSRPHGRRVRLALARRSRSTSKRASKNHRGAQRKPERAVARRSLARHLSEVPPSEPVPLVPRGPSGDDSGFLQDLWYLEGRRRMHRCGVRRISELERIPRGIGRPPRPRARGAGRGGVEHGHNGAVGSAAAERSHVHVHHHVG